MNLKVHRRQWIITRDEAPPIVDPEFRTTELGGGCFLHYEASLPVRHIQGADDQTIVLGILLGDNADRGCGRFVAIRYPWLSLDATGTLGVVFFKQPSSVICSSSIALIHEACGLIPSGRELRRDEGINWDPLPATRVPGLRKMFCDQELDLRTGRVATRPIPYAPSDSEGASALVETMASYLSETVHELASLGRPLFLALTAGRDSRTLLSALLHAKVPFEAFTLCRDSRGTSDAKVAADLCQKFGVRHRSLTPSAKRHIANLEKLKRHTGGAEGDAAQEDVLGDYYRDFPTDAIVLHGGVFELGRRYYENRFVSVNFANSRVAAKGIADAFGEKAKHVAAPLRTWHRYRQAHPIERMDFLDMFYLDQRRGGWGASNQQAQDAFGPDQVIIANSWRAIELLMSPPRTLRTSAAIQMGAAELLTPGIATAVPINPMNFMSKVRRMLVQLLMKWPAAARVIKTLVRNLQRHA
jgi:hypothetical protein